MKKYLIIFQFILLGMVILAFNPFTNRIITLYTAKKYNLNRTYFYKQIASESSFRCFAYSHAKAIGPGQITEGTAKYIDPKVKTWHLWIPWVNIDISAKYTKYLLKKYKGNYSVALAAYNWGETNVDRKLRYHQVHISQHINYRFLFKNITETDTFLKKIME